VAVVRILDWSDTFDSWCDVDGRADGNRSFKVSKKSVEDRVIDWISRHGNKGTAPRDLVSARIVPNADRARTALVELDSKGKGTTKSGKFYLFSSQVRAGTDLDTRDPRFRSDLLRLLRKVHTVKSLGTKLKVHASDVEQALTDLEESGYIVERTGQRVVLGSTLSESARRIVRENHFIDKPIKFGVVADMHLCAKAERLDVLNAAYDEFAAQGIDTVLCPGNYVDGECRYNRHELHAHGIADQCQYCIDHWPQRTGIKTFYIDGDDHEGWWQQREGVEFGRYLMLEAQRQGRNDLVYLGYMEADIELKAPKGSAVVKVIHAGGGSAYAYSYAVQKLAESFQGGEKPAIAIVGHYHKFDYSFPRAIHMLQPGCCEDQTAFMRKRKLAAHVGFCTVELQQDIGGSITRFAPTFYPFWDRGYYLSRDGQSAAKRLQQHTKARRK
jgi:DNA-binding transcriptional regulator YhcF (GntR family)